MTIERTNPYGPLDPAELARFERSLQPLRLPDAYREFLVEFNGARFTESGTFDDVGGTAVEDLLGLHAGPTYLRLDRVWAGARDAVPSPLLVLATDPFGNYYAMSLDGRDREAVYFVDHECLPARAGDLPRVASTFLDFLQRAGADVAPPQMHPDIASAIRAGDHDAIRNFLARGTCAGGQVHHAVHRGDLGILQTVLEAGGDPDELGGIGGSESPLFVAAWAGRADLAAALVGHGANVNLRCSAGGTAIEMAQPYPDVVAVLAHAGAELTTPRLREMVRRLGNSE